MNAAVYEALNLALRWTHVLTAILWVGQTFLFTWLDAQFGQTASGGESDEEPVWMVHSGGFYRVEKIMRPAQLPDPLHWTRWESLLTWTSGFGLLLLLMYTFGGLLRPPGSSTGTALMVAVSLGSLVAGWVVYDALWSSPLGRREPLAAALSLLLLSGLTWVLMQMLSARAAWFHVGAMLGGLMTANVWMRILPAQRRMVASVASGEHLDPSWGSGAKQRSRHNTFIVLPLLLIMLSNHFPTLGYAHRYAWAMLGAWMLVGWVIRVAILRRGH